MGIGFVMVVEILFEFLGWEGFFDFKMWWEDV